MMQSQGLGALMPQAAPQMAPQQDSPRLTAATNLVSSDAEKQILDPRTLALIKYKDAIQAMQAADQMMAAAQPAPMPPTVAERTKLAAEQGIAGLASKLGAGIQRQGSNMQAQQLQQAMSGGLPQLPAPNMAGMAQGGIVGFDAGGDVEGTPDDISPEIRAAFAGYGFTDEQIRNAMRRTKADDMLEPVVEYAIENPVESTAMAAMAVPAATTGLAALGTRLLAQKAPSVLSKLFTRPNPRAAGVFDEATNTMTRGAAGPARVFSPTRAGATTLVGKEGYDYLTAEGGEQPVAAEQASAQTPSPATAATRPEAAAGQPMSDVDRLLAQLESEVGGTAPGGDQGFRMRGVGQPAAGLGSLQTDTGAVTRAETDAITRAKLDPDYVENTRLDVERRAREAYAIPQETRDLYQSRIEALDRPMFTPAEERSRKLRALLSGLASSNVIAEGGPAASRAVAEVSDAIREDSTARAQQQFDLASSLMDKDMQASQQAFSAGLDATQTAMNQQGVALQMAISTLNAADNREAAAIADAAARRIELVKVSLEAAQQGRANAMDVQRNIGSIIRANNDDIAALLATGLPGQPLAPEVSATVEAIRNINAAYQSVFNAASSAAGFPVPEVSSGVGAFNLTPDDEALINQYTR